MKNKLVMLLTSILAVTAMAGCGGGGGSNTIKFYAFGETTELKAYQNMVAEFNETVGKEKGIKVAYSPYPESSYEQKIVNVAYSNSGPDVFMVVEKKFKKWAQDDLLSTLDDYVKDSEEIKLDEIWSGTVSRYRYNVENNTSNASDPLYALPIDSSPTALYYNRSVMEDAGITIIGVAEEDMEAWNNGEIKDKYGKYKSDYEAIADLDVPAKGYWRSQDNYHNGDDAWKPVATGTTLVFNDAIPMNWDEVEDLAMLFTKNSRYNPNSPTQFGFYTEWWFNYGWSVGGDCIQDLTGDGDWTFTLGDYSPNYIVAEDKTFTGASGKVYKEGETLEFLDKLDVIASDVLAADNLGGFTKNGQPFGSEENPYPMIRQAVKDAVESGELQELPSTKVAFTRFARLAGQQNKDLNICPYTTDFPANTSSFGYFVGGNVAMIIEEASNIGEAAAANFEWGVAPLPQYKEYDEYDEEVVVRGIASGHSNSVSVAIREYSKKKDAAFTFVEFLVGEKGQSIKSKDGFVPNQRSLVETDEYLAANPNMAVFLDAMDSQKAGDWWYMADTLWINVWADRLNGDVRNGKYGLDYWYATYIKEANEVLKGYKPSND